MKFRLVDCYEGSKDTLYKGDNWNEVIAKAWEQCKDTDGECDLYVMTPVNGKWHVDQTTTSILTHDLYLYFTHLVHIGECSEDDEYLLQFNGL